MKRYYLAAAVLAAVGVAQAAELTIYKQPGFGGEQLTLRDQGANLDSRFTDQASSVIVNGGRWELCTQPDFKGDCMTLGPGRYSTLDSRLLHRVESARALDVVSYNDRDGYGDNRQAGMEVYVGSEFRGRPFRVHRDMPNIGRSGDGMHVGSVVVNEGRWQLCSDPGYQGYCQVLEPGEYGYMGRFNNQVASIRRIG